MSDYEPVDCGFHDELGLRMMRRSACTLVVETGDNEIETIQTVIQDVFTDGDEEFAEVEGGRRIRLDRIRRVDDVERNG